MRKQNPLKSEKSIDLQHERLAPSLSSVVSQFDNYLQKIISDLVFRVRYNNFDHAVKAAVCAQLAELAILVRMADRYQQSVSNSSLTLFKKLYDSSTDKKLNNSCLAPLPFLIDLFFSSERQLGFLGINMKDGGRLAHLAFALEKASAEQKLSFFQNKLVDIVIIQLKRELSLTPRHLLEPKKNLELSTVSSKFENFCRNVLTQKLRLEDQFVQVEVGKFTKFIEAEFLKIFSNLNLPCSGSTKEGINAQKIKLLECMSLAVDFQKFCNNLQPAKVSSSNSKEKLFLQCSDPLPCSSFFAQGVGVQELQSLTSDFLETFPNSKLASTVLISCQLLNALKNSDSDWQSKFISNFFEFQTLGIEEKELQDCSGTNRALELILAWASSLDIIFHNFLNPDNLSENIKTKIKDSSFICIEQINGICTVILENQTNLSDARHCSEENRARVEKESSVIESIASLVSAWDSVLG